MPRSREDHGSRRRPSRFCVKMSRLGDDTRLICPSDESRSVLGDRPRCGSNSKSQKNSSASWSSTNIPSAVIDSLHDRRGAESHQLFMDRSIVGDRYVQNLEKLRLSEQLDRNDEQQVHSFSHIQMRVPLPWHNEKSDHSNGSGIVRHHVRLARIRMIWKSSFQSQHMKADSPSKQMIFPFLSAWSTMGS
jgi:hypothetical protein